MSASSRRCGTCRWFQDAGMGGTGWCTHPKRQLSNDVRILVRKAELACRNAWGVDLWEAKNGAQVDEPSASPSIHPSIEPQQDHSSPLQASFEDEVTSVVNTDIHRALNRDDLNDRVVDQTSLGPEVETDEDDDRFNLLARGGQDSVSQARNRMLRRRTDLQASSGDDEPTDDAPLRAEQSGEVGFLPDDYIEEESPSPEKRPSGEPAITPDDDVILSEGVSQGTPRSRRLRRTREEPVDPKPKAVVETDADVATPAIEPKQKMAGARSRFDSVPEISAEIDLSRLRRQTQGSEGAEPHASETTSPPPIPVSLEEPFERAIRTAQAIKAAAKAERDGRHKADHRSRTITPPVGHEERQHMASSSVAVHEVPEQANHRLNIPQTSTRQQFVRVSASTPYIDEPDVTDFDEYGADDQLDLYDSRRDDARASWWRGLFQGRNHDAPANQTRDEAQPDHEQTSQEDVWDDHFLEAFTDSWDREDPADWDQDQYSDYGDDRYDPAPLSVDAYAPNHQEEDFDVEVASEPNYELHTSVEMTPVPAHAQYEPLDLQHEQGLSAFRNRLFSPSEEHTEDVATARTGTSGRRSPISLARKRSIPQQELTRPLIQATEVQRPYEERPPAAWERGFEESRHDQPAGLAHQLAPEDLLDHPDDAWYEPEPDNAFDVRDIIAQTSELLDMTIEIAPETPRACATCRSYRESERGERGWCTNNWAFTHRQMVNATDLACQSTIGCWWLPADEEVWLTDGEPERGATPRIDRLVAHLDPLKRAVGR